MTKIVEDNEGENKEDKARSYLLSYQPK